ncbi:ABC-2 transporter permease [Romboutsia sp. 1001713B170131_170501_G6]|uniref:ABC-2 transporter permease n=1 Tax=Romboutsia sp. 1001713B170131_170501_G6 TaxID=2787108 RepID=UPI0018A96933|nr:ABC-2 transporter permease [Romboutsia sp. 1001713B170131_170501_G6]
MNNIINLTKMSLINFKSIFKQVGLILVVWVVMSLFENSFIGMLGGIITIAVVGQLMSYEDMSTIDNIIGTIPVKRKEYVISKYIVGIISMLTTIIVVIIIYNLIDIDITLDLLLTTSILSSTIIISTIIPLIMKFGIVKGRLMMFAVTFFVIFCSMSLADILQEPPRFLESTIYYINNTNPLVISSIVSTLAILISMLICIKMYDKKEFK